MAATKLARVGHYPSWELDEGAAIADGRFALKSLGGGNRYEVYLVWDEGLYALAVAKLLRPDQVSDEKALRDLALELEVLETLAHPVLVRHFDAILDGPQPHLLIEHLEGPSLRRLIKRGGPLALEQTLPLAMHVAGALQYMAQAGFVHLDVKPDNIIMGVPPRLIDLSIARTVERAAHTEGPVGTDPYMPPEQTGSEDLAGEIGPRSDVFGLGVTLYHAIAGRRPWPNGDAGRSGDLHARFPQLGREPAPLPDWVPPALRGLLDSMIRREPGSRPSCADVIAELEPLVERLPRKMSLSRRGAADLTP
jgi:serine/threonine protein kinase